jgi:hypothetical protein
VAGVSSVRRPGPVNDAVVRHVPPVDLVAFM